MQEEAAGCKGGDEYLGKFQTPRDDRFDVFVRQLAAEAGQDEEGKDEDRAGERDQQASPCPK